MKPGCAVRWQTNLPLCQPAVAAWGKKVRHKMFDNLSIDTLVTEIKAAVAQGKIGFTDGKLMVLTPAKLEVGGYFNSSVMRHAHVQNAIDEGDQEKELWLRNWLMTSGAVNSDKGYVRMMEGHDHNLIPDAGINSILDIIFRTAVSKVTNWYQGPIKTNVTPAAGWLSNWSGAGGAAPASELVPTTDYTVSARVEAVFTAAAAKTIACVASRFTLAVGTSGITLYGSTLNSISTAAYNATDKVLAAATLFGTAKSGLGAGDKIDIEYSVTGASS